MMSEMQLQVIHETGRSQAGGQSLRPFLKWPGGKSWLVPVLRSLFPDKAATYYEPFLGAGWLFFALRPEKAVIGDINPRLIETYLAIRDSVENVIRCLHQWPNDHETFYRIRSLRPDGEETRAAQFIYLNKTCWNGLYRVNRKGEFNVPFGNNGRRVFDPEDLRAASRFLSGAEIRNADFEMLLGNAGPGDFVYLDPPYTVMHGNNGFRRYNEKLFSWSDQIRLATVAEELRCRGCFVVVSNADHSSVLSLYPRFHSITVHRHSILAGRSDSRRSITEALLLSSDDLFVSVRHAIAIRRKRK